MAASSRPQPQRNGRSLPRRIVDTIRATLGRGRAALERMTIASSLPARVGRQLSRLARRGRGMAGKIDTIPGTGEPVDRAHTARNLTEAAAPSAGRAANRRQDLEHQTVRQLRERAREAGVQGRSSMTKDQLIKALRDHR